MRAFSLSDTERGAPRALGVATPRPFEFVRPAPRASSLFLSLALRFAAHNAPALPRVRFALCETAQEFERGASRPRPSARGAALFAGGCDSASRWQHHVFEEGKDWVFDDSDLHYAVQASNATRLIFLADFPRPNLPPLARWANAALARVAFPRIPSVSRFATSFAAYYERLARTPRAPGGGDRDVECLMATMGDTDEWKPANAKREAAARVERARAEAAERAERARAEARAAERGSGHVSDVGEVK